MARFLVFAFAVLALPTDPAAGPPGYESVIPAIPDSVQRHLDAGRFWRASLGLKAHLEPLESASLTDRLVLAEAEAGWKNWPGVVEALPPADLVSTDDVPARYWYLLGTALQRSGQADESLPVLERFLDVASPDAFDVLAVRSRLLQSSGQLPLASLVEGLVSLRSTSTVLADWTGLQLAESLKDQGLPLETAAVLDLIVDPAAANSAWSWVADAWTEQGDTAQALAVVEGISDQDREAVGAARVLDKVWRLRLAVGDTSGALVAGSELLRHTVRGPLALGAATQLLARPEAAESDDLLRAADAFSRSRDNRMALRAWELATARGAMLSDGERLARARSMSAVGERTSAAGEFADLSSSEAPEIGAPALASLIRLRRRARRTDDARALEAALVERFPTRAEALDVVYFRGDDQQDAGNYERAVEHYRQVIAMSSSANKAGLARMRWGHIHLTAKEYAAAATVFEDYLEEFPQGRRWEEASYWGAWAAHQLGDEARAGALVERLSAGNPVSYYAVMASRLGPYAFEIDFPEGSDLPEPEWLDEELSILGLLESAGLDGGANAHIEAIKAAAWDSEDVLMRLAVELNDRGRTMDGIRIGWELRRRGRDWDKALMRVVYPFPYRDMVLSVARERGLDPFLMAGMIRQESAFVADIVSHAGAVGLMQVMPATGRQLARAVGPQGFQDSSLTTPELNIHLGSRFLADLLRRYDDMPLVLSAYNAGPSRADRWRKFPEAVDPDRFTERIPFAETRGYVKNVTRNRALYEYLYGDAELNDDRQ
ncbi:MAG: transglycosylase SLT domain-containing protein [Longimicrobiales bacterium]